MTGNRSLQRIGPKEGIVLASLNVNGYRRHLDDLKLLMSNLKINILATKMQTLIGY